MASLLIGVAVFGRPSAMAAEEKRSMKAKTDEASVIIGTDNGLQRRR